MISLAMAWHQQFPILHKDSPNNFASKWHRVTLTTMRQIWHFREKTWFQASAYKIACPYIYHWPQEVSKLQPTFAMKTWRSWNAGNSTYLSLYKWTLLCKQTKSTSRDSSKDRSTLLWEGCGSEQHVAFSNVNLTHRELSEIFTCNYTKKIS